MFKLFTKKVKTNEVGIKDGSGKTEIMNGSKTYLPKNKKYLLLIIFIFLILIFFGIKMFLTFWKFEIPSYLEESNWDSKKRYNVLLIGTDTKENSYTYVDHLSLIEFDPVFKEVRIFVISPLFTLNYVSDNEFTTIKNYFSFYNTLPKEESTASFISAIENFIAVKIDGYVMLDSNNFPIIAEKLGNITVDAPSGLIDEDIDNYQIKEGRNYVEMRDIVKYLSADENGYNDRMLRQSEAIEALLKKNYIFNFMFNSEEKLSLIEDNINSSIDEKTVYKLLMFCLFRSDIKYKISYSEFRQGYLVNTNLGEIWRPVYEDLDKDLQNIFTSNLVKLEQARIDVLNSTDVPGLASSRGRWLKNRGIRVTKMDNFPEKLATTKIFVSEPEKYKATLEEINQTFKGEVEVIPENYNGRTIGDIVIIIGENEI